MSLLKNKPAPVVEDMEHESCKACGQQLNGQSLDFLSDEEEIMDGAPYAPGYPDPDETEGDNIPSKPNKHSLLQSILRKKMRK